MVFKKLRLFVSEPLRASKPLKQPTLMQSHKNTVRTDLHRIGLEGIPPAHYIPPVFQVELELVHRAYDLAAPGHKGIDHRGSCMGTGIGKAIPALFTFRNTDLFAADFHFGDPSCRPLYIALFLGYLMPFVFFKAH